MKIAVIGAGAVGKVVGGLFQAASHEVHYLVRSEYTALKKANHFTLAFTEQNIHLKISPIHVYQKPEQLPKVDLVIISTKTTENKYLKELVTPCLDAFTEILVLQNGIGNEEAIESMLPDHPILCGITTIGANRAQPDLVNISFVGELKLAPYHPETLALSQMIAETFATLPMAPKVIVGQEYKNIRWHKLIWNAAFNPLSVAFDRTAEVLATEQPFKSIVYQVMDEIKVIAAREEVHITDEYIDALINITQAMKNYQPSMYFDYVNQRPLELEYILSNVLDIAAKHKIALPCLTLVKSHVEQQLKMRDLKSAS